MISYRHNSWRKPMKVLSLSSDKDNRCDGYARDVRYYLVSLQMSKSEISTINLETIKQIKPDII
jgi:hypothetical protein